LCASSLKKSMKVILSSRDEDKGRGAADELNAAGPDIEFHQLDVVDPGSVETLYDYVSREFGRLDVLVNNAGIFIDQGRGGLDVEIDKVRDTLETNTIAPLRMCQKFIPLMKENDYGRVVKLSSQLGRLASMEGGWPAYRMSNTALNAVTRVVAAEVKGHNILVNSMYPGWTRTDMDGETATTKRERTRRYTSRHCPTSVHLARSSSPEKRSTGSTYMSAP